MGSDGADEFEDEVLTRLTVDALLKPLEAADRELLRMVFLVEQPLGYMGPWPPTFADIGRYIGIKYEGRPLSEAAIRYRRTAVLAQIRSERGPLRRIPKKEALESPEKGETSAALARPARPTSTPERGLPMDDATFSRYLAKYTDVIAAMARKLARSDEDLFEDLRQDGCITLWGLDVGVRRENEDAWIRKAIFNRMQQYLRRDNPKSRESIEPLLSAGYDIVTGSVQGQRELRRRGKATPSGLPDLYEGQDDTT